jgi:hypothetical protein
MSTSGQPPDMNEEEVKVKIVLPFLASLGIEITDLQLETSFSVQLGRRVADYKKPSSHESRGRLDILVKRGDRNLFIVETKRSNLALTDDDREQAISYAKLVHPIAPFALVTNGTDWKLYNSVTKDEVTSADIRFPDGFTIELPDGAAEEALRMFLRRSPHNVRLFCETQVAAHMAPLRGAVSDNIRAYVPEIQVPRDDLPKALAEFQQSDKPLFALVGESGRGKTCSLCDYALSLISKGKPVLFFNGLSLERGILEAVAEEFNWTFSDAQTPIETIKGLDRLGLGQPLTLIVDAIDEWPYSEKVQNLLGLARRAKPDRMRVVVGCKVETWPAFLSRGGKPTGLEQLLYVRGPTPEKRLPASHIQPGFSDTEFDAVLSKYRQAFAYDGSFDDETLAEAKRDPLLLRILFDVASASSAKHLDLSTSEVIARYLRRRVDRLERPQEAEQTLAAIARAHFVLNSEWIDEGDVRSRLQLRPHETLDPALFHHSILVRRGPTSAPEIGFSVAQLRNFLIAEHVCRWSSADPAAFQASIATLQTTGLHAEVLTSYYRRASEAHRRIIDGESFEAAKEYLHYYRDTIAKHFPSLWRSFPGCAADEPAFYGEFHIPQRRLSFYGFRRSTPGTPSIFLRGVDTFDSDSDRTVAYDYDVEVLHWAGDLTSDTTDLHKKVVKNEIVENLQDLVQGGRLVEDSTPDLVLELLLSMITKSDSAGGGFMRAVFDAFRDRTTRRPRFPIDFDALLESLRRAEITRHTSDDLVEELRPPGQNWFTYTEEFHRELDRRCQAAWKSGYTPLSDTRYMDIERMKAWLPHAIEVLRVHMPSIGGPLLLELPQGAHSTQEELEAYFQEWHLRYLENYRRLVDANFPTLKAALPLYSSLPLRQYIEVEGTTPDGVTHLKILTAKEQPAANEVLIARAIEAPKTHPSMLFSVDGNPVEASNCLYTRALLPPKYVGPEAPNPLSRRREIQPVRLYGMPVRHLVYQTLNRELPKLVDALRSACGISG